MIDYLKKYKEEIPDWLKNYKLGDKVTFDMIMNGRVGYYPGSGFDGMLVTVANQAHCIHSYLYVDYNIEKKELTDRMDRNSFLGYHSIGRIEWQDTDILPQGQYPLLSNYEPRRNPMTFVNKNVTPYCFTEILERDPDRSEAWGAERFAITFLFADGISTYYQLFVKQYAKAPWLFLLQDHGFGGNYDMFGRDGFLDAIIKEFGIYPDFVLCADNTRIWDGYRRLLENGYSSQRSGQRLTHTRYLYCQSKMCYAKALQDEELTEGVTYLHIEETGLPYDIIVDCGKTYEFYNHPLCLYIVNGNDVIPIDITEDINVSSNCPPEIVMFIKDNYGALCAFANMEIDGPGFFDIIKDYKQKVNSYQYKSR